MAFKPCCSATAIGSMPHEEPEAACRVVLDNLTEIPIWPQLPKRSFKENMYVQFTEGMPAVVIDEPNERVFFDTSHDLVGLVGQFYEKFLEDRLETFAISADHASGFHELMKLLHNKDRQCFEFVKGHVTGPVSLGLAVTDENKRPCLYNELLVDPIVKTLSLKARWQEAEIRSAVPDVRTIIFIDEPYLTSFGSAFVSLNRKDVIGYLRTLVGSISGLSGVHCCGNTDWTLFTEAGVDIISFDAFDYTESLALYPAEINKFLNDGGILAWGIVPTVYPDIKQIEKEDVNSLLRRFEEKIKVLVDKGIDHDLLLRACLITPNCGTGGMSLLNAEKVFRLAKEIAENLKARYF